MLINPEIIKIILIGIGVIAGLQLIGDLFLILLVRIVSKGMLPMVDEYVRMKGEK